MLGFLIVFLIGTAIYDIRRRQDVAEIEAALVRVFRVQADFRYSVQQCTRSGRNAVSSEQGDCYAMLCISDRASSLDFAAERVQGALREFCSQAPARARKRSAWPAGMLVSR